MHIYIIVFEKRLGRNNRWKQCITFLVRVREELCTHTDYPLPIESTRIHNTKHMNDGYISFKFILYTQMMTYLIGNEWCAFSSLILS